MNTAQANSVIVTSLAVTGALVVVRDARDGQAPPIRFLMGMTIAGVGMAVLAQGAPEIAGALAALVGVTAALVYGAPAWDALSSSVTPPQSTRSKTY